MHFVANFVAKALEIKVFCMYNCIIMRNILVLVCSFMRVLGSNCNGIYLQWYTTYQPITITCGA